MKKILTLGVFLYVSLQINAKATYYYYNGDRVPISVSDDSIRIYSLDSTKTNRDGKKEFVFSSRISPMNYNQGNESLVISSKEYIVKGDAGHMIQMSNRFYVQLFDSNDYQKLLQIADEVHAEIIGPVPYTKNWYKLVVNNSKIDNSLEMSNYFYETGLFKNIDPGFIFNFRPSCVSDSHFSDQWGLPAIHACDAWDISKGDSSIVIAIVDQGVYTQHTEFTNTQFVNPYDCYTQDSISYTIYGDHGTFICGEIAADHNHAEISGLAPLCKIMPISHPIAITDEVSEELASGIAWAYLHGADVINCSWGDWDGQYYEDMHSTILESTISDALTDGRNGKGCVVVFSSGNQASTNLDYPAYVFPEILAVGAINQTYNRAAFSSMGNDLDLVAPGSSIYSANSYGGYINSSGTSFAAPYVCGVAGLMLSINPFLTRQEVTDLIESTAQKVGSYSYTSQSGRLNGTWNYQMGYGLVDAYAAVLAAKNRLPSIGGLDVLCSAAMYGINNMPSTATVVWSYETDIIPEPFLPVIHILNPTASLTEIQRGTSCFALYNPSQCYYNGTVTLKATITDFGLTRLCTKDILLHEDITPTIPLSQRRKIGLDETRTFCIDNCTDVPTNKLKWVITLPSATSSTTYYGRCWSITTGMLVVHPGTMNIKLYNLENCDQTLYTNYNVTISYLIPDPLLSFANPVTTGIVDINVTDRNYAKEERDADVEKEKRADIDYTLELWSENSRTVRTANGTLKGEKDVVTMDVSNLPNGIYFLTMKVNNEILTTEKMIIIH